MFSKKIRDIKRKRDLERQQKEFHSIYEKYKSYTMVPRDQYVDNLNLAYKIKHMPGDIVECGVWRGGMIAGIAEIIRGSRTYYLFDSFEGLPNAKEIDGTAASEWQNNPKGDYYFDNCKAEMEFAIKAMNFAQVDFKCIKGWFKDTLSDTSNIGEISLLRLDGDWYDSTIECLIALFPKVAENGLIVIDDYYAWSGCSRAVHDYLSSIQSASRINMTTTNIAYIVKSEIRT